MGAQRIAPRGFARAGLSPLAGRPAPDHVLVDVLRLVEQVQTLVNATLEAADRQAMEPRRNERGSD